MFGHEVTAPVPCVTNSVTISCRLHQVCVCVYACACVCIIALQRLKRHDPSLGQKGGMMVYVCVFVCVCPLIISLLQAKHPVPPFHTQDHTDFTLLHIHTPHHRDTEIKCNAIEIL